ncbi:MAG: ATP-binding protein [Candidatus Berkiella sp.]
MSKSNWIKTVSRNDRQIKAPLMLPALNFPQLQHNYHYSFKTLEEGSQLAVYLSSLYPKDCQKKVELGLNELFINAIEHGNLGIGHQLKAKLKATHTWEQEIYNRLTNSAHENKEVTVSLDILPDRLVLQVTDQGDGFIWREYFGNYNQSHSGMHGRGLMMVKELCFDHVTFSEKGNTVTCTIFGKHYLV